MNWRKVAILAIALFLTTGPVQAFKFSFDGVRVVTVDELNALVDDETTEESYTLWMQPSKGVQPPDSFYKLCSWAHELPYRENVRLHEDVHECICIQMELERNWWVRDFNLIYPDEWYGVALTAGQWRNVIARMTVITPVANDSLLAEQVDKNTDAITDLQGWRQLAEAEIKENARAIDNLQKPQQQHGHTVIQKRIEGLQDQQQRTQLAVEENNIAIDGLQDQQRLESERTDENSEAIVTLGKRTQRLEHGLARLDGEVDTLRQTDEQAESDRENLRSEIQTLTSEFERLPTDLQPSRARSILAEFAESVEAFFGKIVEWFKVHAATILVLLLVLLLVFLVVVLVKKVFDWFSTRNTAQTNTSSNETEEDVFTTEVVDAESNRHSVSFERGTPGPDGRERVISPWTGNPILRENALKHAQDKYNKEGLPRQRS